MGVELKSIDLEQIPIVKGLYLPEDAGNDKDFKIFWSRALLRGLSVSQLEYSSSNGRWHLNDQKQTELGLLDFIKLEERREGDRFSPKMTLNLVRHADVQPNTLTLVTAALVNGTLEELPSLVRGLATFESHLIAARVNRLLVSQPPGLLRQAMDERTDHGWSEITENNGLKRGPVHIGKNRQWKR